MSDTDVITVAEAARRLGMVRGPSNRAQASGTKRLRALLYAARDTGKDPFVPGTDECVTIAAIKRACPHLRPGPNEQATSLKRAEHNLTEFVDDRIDATLNHRFVAMRETIDELRSTVQAYAKRVADLERSLGVRHNTPLTLR